MPQYIRDGGLAEKGAVIACTQPMMIATVALAQRVAEERGVVLGGEVWYAIRYSEKFREYFDCCPVRNIPGFMFPVEIMYCKTGGGYGDRLPQKGGGQD